MYEGHYGLHSKPFQLTPDPSIFYASRLHKRALSYLQYGLSQAEGFIVITGEIGTGKTTIANNLLADVEEDIVAIQIVTPKLTPDELVSLIVSKFGVEIANQSKADKLKVLEQYLFKLHDQGKRALLIVDEAQNLPIETVEELRMLSNFQSNGKPLLQSFLLGQAELQQALQAPNMEQFRQRIVASCHLAPLSAEECKDYIEYRLFQSGWEGDELLDDDAHAAVYAFSKGVPRKVNTLMDRVLLFGFLEDVNHIRKEHVDSVVEELKGELYVPSSSTDSPTLDQPYTMPVSRSPNGNNIHDVDYYKALLGELVDALDDAIKHKVKLTQYIDKLLKKKYRTYVRQKEQD